MKKITFLLAILASNFSYSCGNEYGYDLNGERVYTRYFYLSEYDIDINKAKVKKRLNELRKIISPSFKNQSDIALQLMKLGHADSAILILKPLVELHPNEYVINANLGTAYELTGELDKALHFIARGVEINPQSHFGSEWVHVRILEAKIKEKQSPGWIRKNSIIDIEELKSKSSRRDRHLGNHLQIQIRTRVAFTPAPNAVITNLLETLAEYSEKYDSYENTLLAYTYAMVFNPNKSYKGEISKKIIALNKKRKESGIDQLPYQFKRMYEIGRIDPEILLFSIDQFAASEYKKDSVNFEKEDSISLLMNQVDSLFLKNEELSIEPEIIEKKNNSSILFGIIGILIGGAITFFIKRKK